MSQHEAPGAATAESGDRPAPGLFVSFEGGDGAGKSTQLVRVGEWVASVTGREVVRTREPGGTELGQVLRSLVLHGGDIAARAEALIYAADRAQHVAEVIRPALQRGAVVLTDRYLDSSVAYQAGGRELAADEVERLSLWATEGLLPQLTVLLDVDPGRGLARLSNAPDRLERAGAVFHLRTRQAFLDRAAAHPDRWLVLDAGRSRDELTAQILARLAPLLEALPPAPVGPDAGGPVGTDLPAAGTRGRALVVDEGPS